MSEHRTKEKLFRKVPGRRLSGDARVRLSHVWNRRSSITITSAVATRAKSGRILLDVDAAIRLRDWLDRVLP